MQALQAEIAASAARLVVEDGMEYGPAKHSALRQMGLPPRTPLPDNDALEDAVREHIELFCADTQPRELRLLREIALLWMRRMQAFRPYLAGAVWQGTATRHSCIFIQLFCDDSKSAEIHLIDHQMAYDPQTVTGMHGKPVEALTVAHPSPELGEPVGIHLMVYDLDDLRGALRRDSKGRVPRGDLAAVSALLTTAEAEADAESETPPN